MDALPTHYTKKSNEQLYLNSSISLDVNGGFLAWNGCGAWLWATGQLCRTLTLPLFFGRMMLKEQYIDKARVAVFGKVSLLPAHLSTSD